MVDRNEVLQMLSEGKITAAEAINLLDGKAKETVGDISSEKSIDDMKAEVSFASPVGDEIAVEELKASAKQSDESNLVKITQDDLPSSGNGGKPRWLRIRVKELNTGRNKVSINVPVGIVSFGLGIARRFGAGPENIDEASEMWKMLKNEERGVIVDVQDEEDNEHVQISLD